MKNKALSAPKRLSLFQQVSSSKRIAPYCIVIVGIVSTMVLSLFTIVIFTVEDRVEIIESGIRSNLNASSYRTLTIDVSLFNHGWDTIVTVWAEITDQSTQVSYSKAKSLYLGFRETNGVTTEFILDSLEYQGEFTYRVWLTYPSSQD